MTLKLVLRRRKRPIPSDAAKVEAGSYASSLSGEAIGGITTCEASQFKARRFIIDAVVIVVLCAALLLVAAWIIYDVDLPASGALLTSAFGLSTLSFVMLGILLGAILPTTRSAQGVGLLFFFMMLFISGTAPPREVMTSAMQRLGESLPLWHVVSLLQDAWLGYGWNTAESLVVAGVMVGSAVLTLRFFQWR